MKILQERGFFGSGLVPITTPLLVDRYNACLKAIGKEPTGRKRFAIDGAGWSPQIASEKNDPNYLCHGEANLYAIILTPEQRGKPVYMPMHSFDWKILETVHTEHRESIQNLTSLTGVVLDIDQGIDEYHSPFDLLMMHSIVVKASTPLGIMDQAIRQRLMVARFRYEPDAYANRNLMGSLIESAREFGDLRHRSLNIPGVPFSQVQNFYTRALGGVFVFRNCPKRTTPLIITEDPIHKDIDDGHSSLYSTGPNSIPMLRAMERAGLVQRVVRLEKNDQKEALKETIDYLLARAIYQSGCKDNLGNLTAAQKKGLRVQASEHLPEAYHQLQGYLRALDSDFTPPPLRTTLPAWRHALIPEPNLDPLTSDIVWQLLCRVDPCNIEMTFRHSKHQFYRLYQEWNPGQREWAIHLLEKKGLPTNRKT